jgi:hypothetical protein
MPNLDEPLDGITATSSEAERMRTTYFDTDDLRPLLGMSPGTEPVRAGR